MKLSLSCCLLLSMSIACPTMAVSQETVPVPGVPPLYAFRSNAEGVPKPSQEHKIVFDLNSATLRPGKTNPGLLVVAGLLNTYADFGVGREHRAFSVVLRGKFVELATSADVYKHRHGGMSDPNLDLIRHLNAAGVVFAVDARSLKQHHLSEGDLLPFIKVAAAANLMFLELEASGYVYTSTKSLQ